MKNLVKFLTVLALTRCALCYKENPAEYEEESIRHIDYERDQMPIKLGEFEGSTSKVKRMVVNEKATEYREILDPLNEDEQTPAQDRNWQVRPKQKRMTSRGGKKVHIYLKDENKPKRKSTTAATTTERAETTTRRAPETTTKKADSDVKLLKFSDSKDNIAEGSSVKKTASSVDSNGEGSDHHEAHVIKEKIKIKHHHHHHHHNHVKTVVKKEPYPVEKVVHVPIEKVVEKKIPYKVEVPVEKIVEKVKIHFFSIHSTINLIFFQSDLLTQIVHVPKPYPFKVEVPVEKIVEKIVKVPYDR